MDKYELNLKLDQMKSLCTVGDYDAAADVADSVNWSRVRNANALVKVGEIYEKAGRLSDCKELFLLAYDKAPIGRKIIYRLAEIALKMEDYDLAQEYYEEFVDIAPNDNLRFALQYKIRKNQGASYRELISILEEYQKNEYVEDWAYELAKLYHLAGYKEKCVSACDELILWFGDGAYVGKALELKILYHPLTKEQEKKYRAYRMGRGDSVAFKQNDSDDVEDDGLKLVTIPVLDAQPEKFSTSNLQKEIAEGIQQIMDATDAVSVSDTMDNLKRITKDIPFLQIPLENKRNPQPSEVLEKAKSPIENEMLGEDRDGQISMITEESAKEVQITGQITLQDILDDWEKTRKATELVIKKAEEKKLENTKNQALKEATGLMERLNEMIPKLDAGYTTKDIMDEMYLGEGAVNISEKNSQEESTENELPAEENFFEEQLIQELKIEDAKAENDTVVWNPSMNPQSVEDTRQTKKIPETNLAMVNEAYEQQEEAVEKAEYTAEERLLTESAEEVEETLITEPEEAEETLITEPEEEAEETLVMEPVEVIDETPEEMIPEQKELPEEEELEVFFDLDNGTVEEQEDSEEVLTVNPEEAEENLEEVEELEEIEEIEEIEELVEPEEIEEIGEPEELEDVYESEEIEELNEFESADDEADEEDLNEDSFEEYEDELSEDEDPDDEDYSENEMSEEAIDVGEQKKPTHIKRLTNEMRSAFSYFVPIKGMEPQLCQAINVISDRLTSEDKVNGGNLIIQGDPGCGKTVLAASFIKVLQDHCGCPDGKIGHIDGEALNRKNIQQLFRRVAGGCLIIEDAGKLDRNSAISLAYLMDSDETGILVILEDDESGIEAAMALDDNFASKFGCKVIVPIFTNDELVAFARAYAREIGYKIDDMAILALHNRISNIQRLDQATTLAEVKDIVDEAIEKESHFGVYKYFSLVTGKRYTKDDRILLTERHFS